MPTTYDATKDSYQAFGITPDSFGDNASVVTPSDTVDFVSYPKAVVWPRRATWSCCPESG
jgi:hypothetical protein